MRNLAFQRLPFGMGRFGTTEFEGIRGRLKAVRGLTFYANYGGAAETSIDADFSIGSSKGTFTATRGATAPATYYDSSGTIITTTTSNIPRLTNGYYDTTGFHSYKGFLIEEARTNVLTYSSVFENAAWTKTNTTADDTDAGSTSVDGSAQTSSLTASAANGTLTQAFVDAVAGIYTASVFLKRKTGTGTINLRANTGNAYTDITASVLTTTWTRVSVSSTSLTNPTFDLQLATDTDAVYIYGAQLEKNTATTGYATSHIPTTDASLTRGAEKLTYQTSGNRTASQETAFIKFLVTAPFVNDGVIRVLVITTAPTRIFRKPAASAVSGLQPNSADSSSCGANSTTSILAGTSYVVYATCKHTSPYATCGTDASGEGTETVDDFIDNVWVGDVMTIGSNTTPIQHLNGIIQSVVYFSRVLGSGDIIKVTNLLNSI